MSVDIILGTYNGEAYLRDQIESILAQTHTNWRLLIRDDGSKDGTVAIIRDYEKRYHGSIMEVDASGGNVGVIANFSLLMSYSNADYVMFCDQDDIWYPDKIERSLQCMHALEDQHGLDGPLLVHTDACLVNQAMELTHSSFHDELGQQPLASNLCGELIQNTAHGCTMMMNRPLLTLAMPIPVQARMHDMWVHLLALACGHAYYLKEPTLDYRQHDNNVVGAAAKTAIRQVRHKAQTSFSDSLAQAEMVLERVQSSAPKQACDDLQRFITASRRPWRLGTWELLRHYCPVPVVKNAVRLLLR